MRRLFLSLALAAGGAAFAAPASVEAAEVKLDTAQVFPDLLLPSLEEGKLRSISSFRGKKTLLLVFASW